MNEKLKEYEEALNVAIQILKENEVADVLSELVEEIGCLIE